MEASIIFMYISVGIGYDRKNDKNDNDTDTDTEDWKSHAYFVLLLNKSLRVKRFSKIMMTNPN